MCTEIHREVTRTSQKKHAAQGEENVCVCVFVRASKKETECIEN